MDEVQAPSVSYLSHRPCSVTSLRQSCTVLPIHIGTVLPVHLGTVLTVHLSTILPVHLGAVLPVHFDTKFSLYYIDTTAANRCSTRNVLPDKFTPE